MKALNSSLPPGMTCACRRQQSATVSDRDTLSGTHETIHQVISYEVPGMIQHELNNERGGCCVDNMLERAKGLGTLR